MFIKWIDLILNTMIIFKNGRKRVGQKHKQITHPTIYKIFTGINIAIEQYDHWKEKSDEITSIVIKYLIPNVEKHKK